MSWQEIMELREELADIRKKVGGHAIRLGEGNKPKSVDDDLKEVRDSIQKLKELVETIAADVQTLKTTTTDSSLVENTISQVVTDLKASTDNLDETVKTKTNQKKAPIA